MRKIDFGGGEEERWIKKERRGGRRDRGERGKARWRK